MMKHYIKKLIYAPRIIFNIGPISNQEIIMNSTQRSLLQQEKKV